MKPQAFKQVIIIRSDLRMGKGKTAVQVAHASVLGANKVKEEHAMWYTDWQASGGAKIAAKVSSLGELMRAKRDAEKANLPVVIVEDRGLTQLRPGTITCIGIGPAQSDKIDCITSHLKLL